MTSRISHTSVDSRNAYAQSRWWGEVLGFSEDARDPNEPGHEECMVFSADGRTRLLFIEVPEGKTGKNRLHLDLHVGEERIRPEVERLVALGAVEGQEWREVGGHWIAMTDPEGNEFDVE